MPKAKTHNKQLNRRKKLLGLGVEFFKLQVAGNIPFWGTYILYALFDNVFFMQPFVALLLATIASNAVFFVVNDQWVFRSSRKKRRVSLEIVKFTTFMVLSSLLTFTITWLLYDRLEISPYIGQFITAGLSILWTFTGLKFWVFAPPRPRNSPRARRAKA